MKILTNSVAIRRALSDLRPSKIAVAYVGRDWRNFISEKCLKEIVLSPTLGSNPKAIEDLFSQLGDEHVYFLEELHAKFYIGDREALLGSCNLSANGIGENRLLEAAVTVDGDGVPLLRKTFDRYKLEAQRRYPTLKTKMDRLHKLQAETNRAYSGQFLAPVKNASPITGYRSKLDRIHVIAITDPDGEPIEQNIAKREPKLSECDFDEYFKDWVQFQAGDDVRPGDWLLCWGCTSKRLPDKRCKPCWVYAHYVVADGMTSKRWPKFVGEVGDKFRRRPPVPFDLDSSTQAAIVQVLRSGKFPDLFPARDWRLNVAEADTATPKFLDAVKNQVANMR
ncbi:MAG: phospholipase D family protein [Rhodanobacteraceae bacterium]